MSSTSGRQRVQKACFNKFLLAQPDTKSLAVFSEQVSHIFSYVHVLEQKNANLRQTRDLLLSKLISGEIDVEGLEIITEGENYE